jgi:phosphoribosylglycinamide formyltransferase-1
MHSIIIFASGGGSNAAAIISHFRNSETTRVSLIVSNKADAGVVEIAKNEGIPFLIITKKTFGELLIIEQLQEFKPSIIVLAGFLWKVPEHIIHAFSGMIINIHPALLPAYGGKGMHGQHVHQAVISAGEQESGITVHYVNEAYDEGQTLLQARCNVLPADSPLELSKRVLKLEHFYLPRVIEFYLANLVKH